MTALAAKASERGVSFEGGVTVTGFDIRDGRVHGVETDRGRIDVRAGADLRGHLGADRGRAGRCAGAARRRAAPARVDGSDPRARRRDARGRAPDPSSPGSRDVLPSPRGPLRRRQLPTRADRHAAARHPSARRRADAVADAVHPRGLRVGRARGRARAPGARRSHASRRPRPVDQRDVLVHAGCRLDRRRVGERPRPLALRGGVGHARRRDGTAGRRVDGERRARLRPGRGGREPLLPVPDDAAVRAGQGRAAVPRGLRHPASAAADDRAAEAPADAVLRPPRGARRGVLHRRGMGTPAMVRGEPSPADRCRLGTPRRVGRDELVARRRRRAPGHPRARGAVRHHAVRQVRRHRAGCARLPRADLREPDRPSRRLGRLHGDAHAVRRDPVRPDGDAQGRRAVPRRDGRRLGPARPGMDARADPRRRARDDHRADRLAVRARAVGTARRATCCRPSPTPTCRTTRSRT